jgi:two-component system chemotaxis response regulator CheY
LLLIGFKNVDYVSDGSTALARLRQKQFGLVMSDWNMQPMTGFMLLKEIRSDPRLAGMPFVMVTSEATLENVVAAKNAGVSNYVVKPFTGKTLRDKIDEVFASDN